MILGDIKEMLHADDLALVGDNWKEEISIHSMEESITRQRNETKCTSK